MSGSSNWRVNRKCREESLSLLGTPPKERKEPQIDGNAHFQKIQLLFTQLEVAMIYISVVLVTSIKKPLISSVYLGCKELSYRVIIPYFGSTLNVYSLLL
jgi:hypothetical protein